MEALSRLTAIELDTASLAGMVNGHRVFRLSEAAAAVDKESTMTHPNQTASDVRRLEARARLEFRVRPMVLYSVSRFAENEGSTPLVDKLSLDQANIIAEAYGAKNPGSVVTTIQEDRRRFDTDLLIKDDRGEGGPVEVGVYQRLMELPAGSRLTFWREPARGDDHPKLVMDWNVPRSADVQASETIDYSETNWTGGGLMWGEVEEIKTKLCDLPYPLAAAMRRNARASGDSTMLRLLDEAKVAVGA